MDEARRLTDAEAPEIRRKAKQLKAKSDVARATPEARRSHPSSGRHHHEHGIQRVGMSSEALALRELVQDAPPGRRRACQQREGAPPQQVALERIRGWLLPLPQQQDSEVAPREERRRGECAQRAAEDDDVVVPGRHLAVTPLASSACLEEVRCCRRRSRAAP